MLACQGYHNRVPQTRWLKQLKLIFSQFCKSSMKVPEGLVFSRPLSLVCRRPPLRNDFLALVSCTLRENKKLWYPSGAARRAITFHRQLWFYLRSSSNHTDSNHLRKTHFINLFPTQYPRMHVLGS